MSVARTVAIVGRTFIVGSRSSMHADEVVHHSGALQHLSASRAFSIRMPADCESPVNSKRSQPSSSPSTRGTEPTLTGVQTEGTDT